MRAIQAVLVVERVAHWLDIQTPTLKALPVGERETQVVLVVELAAHWLEIVLHSLERPARSLTKPLIVESRLACFGPSPKLDERV